MLADVDALGRVLIMGGAVLAILTLTLLVIAAAELTAHLTEENR